MTKNVRIAFSILCGIALLFIAYEAGAYVHTSKNQNMPVTNAVIPTVSGTQTSGSYTLAQVAEHATQNDCWLIVGGKVYDVTSFIPDHPGGARAIISECGKDASTAFNGQPAHQRTNAAQALSQFYVGTLAY